VVVAPMTTKECRGGAHDDKCRVRGRGIPRGSGAQRHRTVFWASCTPADASVTVITSPIPTARPSTANTAWRTRRRSSRPRQVKNMTGSCWKPPAAALPGGGACPGLTPRTQVAAVRAAKMVAVDRQQVLELRCKVLSTRARSGEGRRDPTVTASPGPGLLWSARGSRGLPEDGARRFDLTSLASLPTATSAPRTHLTPSVDGVPRGPAFETHVMCCPPCGRVCTGGRLGSTRGRAAVNVGSNHLTALELTGKL